jgi:S-adenosylmethionine:tRNA ribosyltransferase-isomerase
MIAASAPVQRLSNSKLLVVDVEGRITDRLRADLVELLLPGDLLIANDAATLPAALFGFHVRTQRPIEVRLAGRPCLHSDCIREFVAVVFGDGDYRTPTEHRPDPPRLRKGDILQLGPLRATVLELIDHPRLLLLCFEGTVHDIWEGLARHGRPIQYAHVPTPLAIWDTWTPIAGVPVAFEPPSASFILDWSTLQDFPRKGIQFATITLAAGISSTGEPDLDARFPLDEPYRISGATARRITEVQSQGGRVIAVGTSVVRALEHAANHDGIVNPGEGLARQKIGQNTNLLVVDAIVSGAHESGTSHFELLRAFVPDETLEKLSEQLELHHYRSHEFGDSVFIEKMTRLQWQVCKSEAAIEAG